jgi:hypothetical protein
MRASPGDAAVHWRDPEAVARSFALMIPEAIVAMLDEV